MFFQAEYVAVENITIDAEIFRTFNVVRAVVDENAFFGFERKIRADVLVNISVWLYETAS